MIGKRILTVFILLLSVHALKGQQLLSEELLWKFGQVGAPAVSPDSKNLVYSVRFTDLSQNKGNSDLYLYNFSSKKTERLTNTPESESGYCWRPDGQRIGYLSNRSGSMQLWEMRPDGSDTRQVSQVTGGIEGFNYSPDGSKIYYIARVRLEKSLQERYPELSKSTGRLYESLMYRHWDTWHDGSYSHVFVQVYKDGSLLGTPLDVLEGEKFHAPLPPFGGTSEIQWSPNSKSLVYVSKKLSGTSAARSTNSEIYWFDLETKKTKIFNASNPGYDNEPLFSPDNKRLAWLSMSRDGYEADKNRIMVMDLETGVVSEVTKDLDISVSALAWGKDCSRLFYSSYDRGTIQVFEHFFKLEDAISTYGSSMKKKVGSITAAVTSSRANHGGFSYVNLGKSGTLVYQKQSMSSPNELFQLDLSTKKESQISWVNQELHQSISFGKVESREIKASDGKNIQTWVIYPPNFDPSKKYPALLYCQGGPQSMIGQSWSNRWNFQLMAAKGYIVLAPNRRGLPGFGQAWNEQISGDWGGQAMQDYLAVVDTMAKENYVDANRLGAVGASFGGYSVYWLAGNHNKRFKTFISHCGVYNLESMYGQTEELFFTEFEMQGKPWDLPKPISYDRDSPHKYVKNWDTPILVIHNEKDFRVPLAQGMEAFTAAQVQGIQSKFLYFPDENHWVVKPQNSVLWNKIFFDWLDTYLKK